MIPGLETDRLLLCPLELADAEQVQQIFPRWEIVRYLANLVPWPYPADGAVTYYRDVALPAMARGEQWHWTLRPRAEPQRIIGQVSLMTGEDHNRGFWLSLPWQGKGIMSEAVDVVTEYWFNSLGFSLLRTPKAIPNLASIHRGSPGVLVRTAQWRFGSKVAQHLWTHLISTQQKASDIA